MTRSPDFYLWVLALTALLFLPARHIIWVLAVRRAEARDGKEDEARRQVLKRRANFTSVLLCFVFAFFYVSYLVRT